MRVLAVASAAPSSPASLFQSAASVPTTGFGGTFTFLHHSGGPVTVLATGLGLDDVVQPIKARLIGRATNAEAIEARQIFIRPCFGSIEFIL